MKAIEFQTKLRSKDKIDVPIFYQDQLQPGQDVRVLLLTDDVTDEQWTKYTTTQFFAGYSDEDAVYDDVQ